MLKFFAVNLRVQLWAGIFHHQEVEYSNKEHTDKTQLLEKGSKETRKYSDKSINP